ncbi:MAG: hypothetical protein PF444_02975, partial [Bacteroidales bacterium]|nr:hypothetical protein [Bacteroidales bacterium]
MSLSSVVITADTIASYSFSHLSLENGLSNNFVKSIYKDSLGYLWFGTLDGIDRYDGQEIRNFNDYFSQDAMTMSVTSVYDDGTLLWIGTDNGLFYWDRMADHFVPVLNEKVAQKRIGKIGSLGSQYILFNTSDSFYTLDIHSLEIEEFFFHKEVRPIHKQITDFIVGDNELYFCSEEGFVQLDLLRNCSIVYNRSHFGKLCDGSFTCMTKVDNSLYLGTSSDGIIRFNLETSIFSAVEGFEQSIILSLTSYDSTLYVGTDSNGLLIYDIDKCHIQAIVNDHRDPSSIASNAIYALLIDDNETLWTGTYTGGVSYSSLKNKNFQFYSLTSNYSLSNKSIRSLCFSNSHRFIGTRDGLYVIGDQGQVDYFSIENSVLEAKIILTLFEYKGTVLIGTYGGGIYSYSFATNKISKLNFEHFNGEMIYAFKEDKEGSLWIATLSGLYKVREQNVLRYDAESSDIVSDHIYALEFDSSGRLWIGTDKGAAVYETDNN